MQSEGIALASPFIPVPLSASPPRRRRGVSSPPSVGRSVLIRILKIHERLAQHRRATAASLARELGVSDRTIKRDIETMRIFGGAVIAWEPSTRTYVYEKPCEHLPLLSLDGEEALALILASRVFAAWRGTALGQALTAALEKIATTVGGAISLPSDEVERLIFQPDDGADANGELRGFAFMLTAIRRRRELALRYRKPSAPRAERRVVHPLQLAWLDHRWVLVAHDPRIREPRKFLLGRIEKAEETGERFEPPAEFDIAAYLAGSFGLFTGERIEDVRVRFDTFAAAYIRERRWHPSQTLRDLPGGTGVEVTLRLNNLIDVRRWVLSWGAHAEVLGPPELREAVRTEAEALVARHSAGANRKSYSQGQPVSQVP